MSAANGRGFDRSYKRGAIMGLTVAEAFILLSFCLLLLFTWWQRDTEERAQALSKFSDAEVTQIKAGLLDGTIAASIALKKVGIDAVDLATLAANPDLSRFMREEDLQRLMKGVVKLPPDLQLSLADAVEVTPEAAMRAALQEMTSKDSTLNQIAGRIEDAARNQASLQTLLDQRLGKLIRDAGGSIDKNGTITLPEAVLFEAGQDRIKNKEFLLAICGPWIDTLRGSRLDISSVQIEGHASSEWTAKVAENQAYLLNLDLSQRRAQEALVLCLDGIDSQENINWAREHLAAIGYSSAQRIMRSDGSENQEASRRVEFSVAMDQQKLIEDIKSDVSGQ
jgi:outer membrane protein OmpA-like peptidoglycan-associated protein